MDKALKQRLVGASVLIALAVIVLPMLLSGDRQTAQESSTIELPERPPEVAVEVRRFPIGKPEPGKPSRLDEPPEQVRLQSPSPSQAEKAVPTPDPVAEQQKQLPEPDAGVAVDSSPDPVEEPTVATVTPLEAPTGGAVQSQETDTNPADSVNESAPAPEPVPEEPAVEPVAEAPVQKPVVPVTPPSAPANGRYLVQVASFSSTTNADRLATRIRSDGMPVIMDTVESSAGILHRVRIGPFESRAAADEAIARLKAEVPDVNPRVLDLRPQESAPVSNPSDPLVRWVVQVGSFSGRENAETLVFRLRDAGYAASSPAVTRDGTTSYKVRVGPVLQREDAVKMAADIKREFQLDGLVMSAD